MSPRARLLAVAGAIFLMAAPAAFAHQGNPNYRSHIVQVNPRVPGVKLSIGDYSSDLILSNHSKRTVTVLGYGKEPFARILANGTAQYNKRSPSYYLNEDYYGKVTPPKFASDHAKPQWVTVNKAGQYEWHDHRIHWMSRSLPPQVKDKSKTTKIFNWAVPIRVGHQRGEVAGDLYWKGVDDGFPLWALISGIALVVASLALAITVQRRRVRDDEVGSGARRPSAGEAW